MEAWQEHANASLGNLHELQGTELTDLCAGYAPETGMSFSSWLAGTICKNPTPKAEGLYRRALPPVDSQVAKGPAYAGISDQRLCRAPSVLEHLEHVCQGARLHNHLEG